MDTARDKKKIEQLRRWLGTGSINIFGKPFSGKDTQANRLAELFEAVAISSGDILRNSGDEATKKIMAKGQIAPTNTFINLVLPFLSQDNLQNNPLILSSIGRWHGEEKAVMRYADQSGHPLKAVIYLDIPDRVFYERWEKSRHLNDRGVRDDDNAKSLEMRLHEFNAKTLPVLEFYKQQNLLIAINGEYSKDTVTHAIINSLAATFN
jgi:adenylate kinase